MSRVDPTVELHLGGTWTDVTEDVRGEAGMRIERGSASEIRRRPSTCALTLDNETGDYSPRNPLGIHFGSLGRNSPMRVTIGQAADAFDRTVAEGWGTGSGGDTWTVVAFGGTISATDTSVSGGVGHHSVPTVSSFRRTYIDSSTYGVVDVRVTTATNIDNVLGGDLEPANITLREVSSPSARYTLVRLVIKADQSVTISVHSSVEGELVAAVTVPGLVHTSSQALTVRAVAEGSTVHAKVWAADTAEPAGWHVSGHDPNMPAAGWVGVRSGVASANSNSKPILYQYDNFTVRSPRWAGEVSKWPVRSDRSGADVVTAIQGSGLLRRLEQGASPLRSALYRGIAGQSVGAAVAYWSCEDGRDTTQLASALPGHPPMTITGEVTPAAFTGAPSSAAIPTYTTGSARAPVRPYAPSEHIRMFALVSFPDTIAGDRVVMQVQTQGSVVRWQVVTNSLGDLTTRAYDADNNLLVDAPIAFEILGATGLLRLFLSQDGSDIDYQIGFSSILGGGGVGGGTLASRTLGNATVVTIGSSGADLNGMAIGHVALYNADLSFWDLSPFAQAWLGETAGDRMIRLSREQGVTFVLHGAAADTETMGPQLADTYLKLMAECADVDQGVLGEPRGSIGLAYLTRASLYNQTAQVTFAVAQTEDPENLSPLDDDRATVNEITVSRPRGSSATYARETGPLSVADPPDGAGRYNRPAPVTNVQFDSQLPTQAAWRVHIGTVDEPRLPAVEVNLVAEPDLYDAVLAADAGSRLVITDPPSWLPPDDISTLIQGYTEVWSTWEHTFTWTLTPESPYRVAVFDDEDLGRADTSGSHLAARTGVGDTVLTVGRTGDRVEDFEDTDLEVTVTGTWARTQITPQAGSWCLASADIADSENSDAFIAIPAGARRMRFWYRVSSESGFDFFTVYVDGVEALQDSGEVAWTQSPEIDVTGKALVSLRYAKDSSASEGEDAAYIDGVTFLGAGVSPVWTTDPAEPPIDLMMGGEKVTATAIGGPVADGYTRTVADGWGAATTGQTWASSGAATDYDVTGGQGLIALSTVGVARWCTVDLGHAGAVDIRGTVATDVLAAGGPHLPALVARYVDTSNSYLARLVINTDATIAVGLLKIVAGVETGLASVATGITHTAAGRVALRMTIDGTTLRAKAWAADTAEPAGWTVTATDGDLTTGTRVGIYGRLSSGCTNPLPVLMSCEDVVVSDGRSPQRFVVTRSVNTVIKTHAAGTDIRLAQPAILAW